MTFLKYLLDKRLTPVLPHPSYVVKEAWAIMGIVTIVPLTIYLSRTISEFFLLLFISIPFLWHYLEYCEKEDEQK